jgi:ribosomal protein S13
MSAARLKQLNLVIDLTKLMRQKAELAEWEQLNKLETQRQQYLKKIFPENEEVSADLQSILENLINLNTDLQQYCQQKKQDLRLEMQGLSKNKQAINAYKSV